MDKYKKYILKKYSVQAKLFDNSEYSKFSKQIYPYVLKELANIQYSNILDVGCGTGNLLLKVIEKNKKTNIYGIDMSPDMLDIAKIKMKYTNATLIEADAENLPFADDFFDVVICIESFHNYSNKEKALLEIKRVLKNNGRFIICDNITPNIIRQIINIYRKFKDKNRLKKYSKNEILNLIKKMNFRNINFQMIGKNIYMCVGTK